MLGDSKVNVDSHNPHDPGTVGRLDLQFERWCVESNLPNSPECLQLHRFAYWRVLLIVPSKPPSLVTNWSSSKRQYFLDICRVLSCYHPSEAPRHSRPIYQRLGRNVHFRITIPYGYQFQEKDEQKEVGGPPRPADAGVPVTTSQSDCGFLLDRLYRVNHCSSSSRIPSPSSSSSVTSSIPSLSASGSR